LGINGFEKNDENMGGESPHGNLGQVCYGGEKIEEEKTQINTQRGEDSHATTC